MEWIWSVKGLLALTGTCLLVWHMATKREPMTPGQMLRYLTLLYFAVNLTGASVDQARHHPPVHWYNLTILPGLLLLVLAGAVSLHESRTNR